MSRIGICGNFDFKNKSVNGQTIKTHNIEQALKQKLGDEQVNVLDTADWRTHKILFLLQCIKLAIVSDNIIILPAQNAIKILLPLFYFFAKILGKRLHYIVIGGWLSTLLEKNKYLVYFCRNIDFIYPETSTLIKELENLSISQNVYIMPNFKAINPVQVVNQNEEYKKPLNLCIVSRIHPKKGIESAIHVISRINKNANEIISRLDIYGPIEENYLEHFNVLMERHKDFVKYKGVIESNETTNVIKDYYLLLFPTKYYTEGLPGTILDAYFSGVPVVASKWESWSDIVIDEKTGRVYDFNDENDFYLKTSELINDTNIVSQMKKNCIKEAEKYTIENSIQILLKNIK